jgi:hypothetical protein
MNTPTPLKHDGHTELNNIKKMYKNTHNECEQSRDSDEGVHALCVRMHYYQEAPAMNLLPYSYAIYK